MLDISADLSIKLANHLFGNLEDTVAVLEIEEGELSLLKLVVLISDELVLLVDVLLDLFEKQVDGFLLVVSDFPKLVEEAVDVLWLGYIDVVLFALVKQVGEFSLAVLTALNLGRVGKVVR